MQVSKIDPGTRESDAKQELVEKIDTYIQEKIVFADNVLVTNAVAKVYDEDIVLTYGFSSVVFNVLLRARQVTTACCSSKMECFGGSCSGCQHNNDDKLCPVVHGVMCRTGNVCVCDKQNLSQLQISLADLSTCVVRAYRFMHC